MLDAEEIKSHTRRRQVQFRETFMARFYSGAGPTGSAMRTIP
jgi:hypothetical protein